MSEQNTTPPASNTPAPAPVVDEATISKIAQQAAKVAAEEAGKTAKSAVQDAFKALAGEKEQKGPDPLHVAFKDDPTNFVKAIVGLTKEEVKKESEAERKQRNVAAKVEREALEEFPELKEHLEYADFEAAKARQEDPKLSFEEALKEGVKRTAKKLNLKSVSELRKEGKLNNAMFPPSGGGMNNAAGGNSYNPQDPAKLQKYLQAQREAAAVRQRKK